MKALSEMRTKISRDGCNHTQLNVEEDLSRNIFHRDRLAHYFRWAHLMRAMKQGHTVLDLGCGDGALATMLYANRFTTAGYLGLDIRSRVMEFAQAYFSEKKFNATFASADLCRDGWQQYVKDYFKRPVGEDSFEPCPVDIIACFEFIEHIPLEQVESFLVRVKQVMDPCTRFYLSTPCFDGMRKAENHIHEWTYQELRLLLTKHFRVEDHWGTFISQKDLEPLLEGNEHVRGMWARLRTYYGSESLAILFAPLFPAAARNCVWKLSAY